MKYHPGRFASLGLALLLPLVCTPQGGAGDLRVRVLAGEGAINDIRHKAAVAPVVAVEDQAGQPVRGAKVTFALPFGGPGATFRKGERSVTVLSDERGRADAPPLTPTDIEGRFNIKVSVTADGREATAVISQRNSRAAGMRTGRGGGSLKKYVLLAVCGGAAAGLSVALRGSSSQTNTPAPPAPVSVSLGSVVVGGPK